MNLYKTIMMLATSALIGVATGSATAAQFTDADDEELSHQVETQSSDGFDQRLLLEFVNGNRDPIEAMLGDDARTRMDKREPLEPLGPYATCTELYDRVTLILEHARPERQPFYQDPATAAFSAIGIVGAPGFYLLGASQYMRIKERTYVEDVQRRTEILRRRLADKRCFYD